MYLLQFFAKSATGGSSAIDVEYRLACSGELCNRKVITAGDYRKSDVSRVLLRHPLELFVVGHPFDAYPQELCIRLSLDYVTERHDADSGSSVAMFLPDQDVVEDFCSILSLLSRRLISPVIKTRERHRNEDPRLGLHDALGSYGLEVPTPILNLSAASVWEPRPLTLITSMEGQKIVNNNPPAVGVDPWALAEFFMQLPKMTRVDQIVFAARLYRAALEMIGPRPDIAYLLLISTVESLADVALNDYEPTESEKMEAKPSVRQCARDLCLTEEQTRQLVVAACKSDQWTTKKFKKFLLDFVSFSELKVEDRVFTVPSFMCPLEEEIPRTLGRIYKARSDNVHVASPFPRSIGVGTTTGIDVRALPPNWISGARPEIPPVTWFERVVWLAASRFLLERSGVKSTPCLSV